MNFAALIGYGDIQVPSGVSYGFGTAALESLALSANTQPLPHSWLVNQNHPNKPNALRN